MNTSKWDEGLWGTVPRRRFTDEMTFPGEKTRRDCHSRYRLRKSPRNSRNFSLPFLSAACRELSSRSSKHAEETQDPQRFEDLATE